ncbi:MAG: DNA gyrase inhibitor YacG [Phycisphaerae bacterium]|nr:DNA gyrase inhibitor YacG [Phycisphaerae bacterium]
MPRKGHPCPTCSKTVQVVEGAALPPYYPFCSERCKLVDLGSWLDGRYKIVSPLETDGRPGPEHQAD